MKCGHCDEEVDPALRAAAEGGCRLMNDGMVVHHECLMRMFIGSVSHLQFRCGCYVEGSEEDDPPGMTKHQAALAALRLYNRLHTKDASNDN